MNVLYKIFVNCCGAIDGTHFTLQLSEQERCMDWYDRYGIYTMAMQVVVGLIGVFWT